LPAADKLENRSVWVKSKGLEMEDLSKFDIATAVTDSLLDLFDSMLSMDLELSDEESVALPEGSRITGSVRMAGKVMGAINIQVSDEFSKQMTAAMLGVEEDEVEGEEDVKDVISEVCNIVGGNLKSKFCDSGMTCQLSPPAFTRGTDFKIESLNTARHERYVFLHEQHPVIIDVGVRINQDETVEIGNISDASLAKPIDKEAFLSFDMRTPLSESMIEMFDMMLSMDLEISDSDAASAPDEDKIVATVSYIGQLMGSINIYISEPFARTMTATMLGVSSDEITGYADVKDVVSEVCNIVGGNLKSKLDDKGFASNLSTPSMTIGSDFNIESKNMTRYEKLTFRHGEEMIYVEVGIKADDNLESEPMNIEAEASAPNPETDAQTDAQMTTGAMDAAAVGDDSQGFNAVGPGETSGNINHTSPNVPADHNLDFLFDVPVAVTVELGRTRKKIEEVIAISNGTVVELSKLAHEPVDIRVNDTLIAKGEIVVDKDKYGVRILETISRLQRIRSL